MYVNVACIQVGKAMMPLDRLFTYEVPVLYEDVLGPGSLVLVPFGFKNQLIPACVIDLADEASIGEKGIQKMKAIHEPILGLSLTQEQLLLALWVRENDLLTYGEALGLFIPAGLTIKNHVRYYRLDKPSEKLRAQKPEKLISEMNNETFIDVRALILNLIESEPGMTPGQIEKGVLLHLGRHTHDVSKLLAALVRLDFIECQRYCEIDAAQGTELEVTLIKNVEITERFVQQKALVDKLREWDDVATWTDLRQETGASLTALKALVKSGVISVKTVESLKLPEFFKGTTDRPFTSLSKSQEAAYHAVISQLGSAKNYLLHGVTGSGKTQIYIEWVREIVGRGQCALVLVPEISLTPQTCSFFARATHLRMAIFHSKLSPRERFDQWKLVERGEIDLVIGARSAVFAPFRNLGLVIVDEEHDSSYRSDHSPRYDARRISEQLGQLFNCAVVMGSATPRLSRYHESKNRENDALLTLTERFGNAVLPNVHVIDMREELTNGNRSIFSGKLKRAVDERLALGEQTILYLNRKGHSTFVSCRSCGYVMSCPHCDISMTYFKGQDRVKCGYCGHETAVPKKCPSCDSPYFRYFGHGTEKIEELVREAFPSARVARLDATITAKKGQMEVVYENMQLGNTDILVGTQLVSKGLDFPGVTLVGILSADTLLHLPDYSAAEKTYQQLTQVAGRAGRGDTRGEVVLQTYQPTDKAIVTAANQAFHEFCTHELPIRELFGYPPYKQLILLTAASVEKKDAFEAMNRIRKGLEEAHNQYQQYEVLGPYQNAVSRKQGKYRYQLILKTPWGTEEKHLKNRLRQITMDERDQFIGKGVQLSIVVEPDSLMD